MPGWLRLYYSSGALARGFDGARRGALGRIDARLRCLVAMSAGDRRDSSGEVYMGRGRTGRKLPQKSARVHLFRVRKEDRL